jgi:predicted molibdopterin-dependent oxidoreductase YjgC
MKGQKLQTLSGQEGKLVWVEFQSADSASCENCGACGTARLANQVYHSGVYRVEGHFLVSPEDKNVYFHEFIPRIEAFYTWEEA